MPHSSRRRRRKTSLFFQQKKENNAHTSNERKKTTIIYSIKTCTDKNASTREGSREKKKKADVLMCNINIHSLSFWMSSSASPEMIDWNVVCVRWVDIDDRRVLVPLVNSIEFSGEILCLLF